MRDLEKRLGYTFRNRLLLTQALTHSSMTRDIHQNYERLEFLGDRILGVTIADMLCKTFVDESEGDLAQRFVRLVCKETVASVMRALEVPNFIAAANSDVCQTDNVLCDVGEAIIAAIYLDSGDMDTARAFVRRHWLKEIELGVHPKKDYKTLLQEQAAARKLPTPNYLLIEKTGPEHAPTFLVEVHLGDDYCTSGQGKSKKQAEAEAAKKMLRQLRGADE